MKKIILVGKGASGKNHLLERFEKRGYRHIVSHTTRPMRDGEREGVEYHFVNKDEFEKMISNDEIIEYQEFNGNYYGISKNEWDNSDIAIMAREGIDNLNKLNLRNECFVIYLDIPCVVRKSRLIQRGDTPDKIEKRLSTDKEEFKDFNDYDLRITNEDF